MPRGNNHISLAQLLFSYKGRINRGTYGLYWLIYGILVSFLILVESIAYITPVGLLGTMLLYTTIPVTVKRLHDVDKPGKYLFWLMVPIAGIIYMLILLWTPGTFRENRYGETASEVILKM